MTTIDYDLDDEAIRDMIAAHHVPEEQFKRSSYGDKYLAGIECSTCRKPWPCEPIQRLRRWESQQ